MKVHKMIALITAEVSRKRTREELCTTAFEPEVRLDPQRVLLL